MGFSFYGDGTMTLEEHGVTVLGRSPVGMITLNGMMSAPVSADVSDGYIVLHYGADCVTLTVSYRDNGSLRLEVSDIPDRVDGFTFGPYVCPEAVRFGDMVGAAWAQDGSAVCIQGLNTKTVGEIPFAFRNESKYPSPCARVAGLSGEATVISCSAENMTRHKTFSGIDYGFQALNTDVVQGDAGRIMGAAIALLFADSTEALLQDIGRLELEEGLPHPMIDGEWAKTSPHASDIYLVFNDGDPAEQLEMAALAGVKSIYFSDPFESWGHFGIHPSKYPGGREQFCRICTEAAARGIRTGFHTLSNFIHTRDSYVSPVPHADLLTYDRTSVTSSITEKDDVIPIKDSANYGKRSTLNVVRIGDEMVQYAAFDEGASALIGCERGAFNTVPASHSQGEPLARMADHGYATLFPNIRLQGEMAETIGKLVRDAHVGRISFDGMEGCFYTGRGEYAASEFVKKVFDITGYDLICDASNCSHYRWHAHSYFNHGEPWYDADRRGGMYNQRIRNQEEFQANLLPAMLGWYVLWNSDGDFEPTLPETLEAILSRTVGFNAGLCFVVQLSGNQQKAPGLLDAIRRWQAFRQSGPNLPDALRRKLRLKYTDWHLEQKEDRWILSELELEQHDLSRVDNRVVTESGTTGYASVEAPAPIEAGTVHASCIVCDRSSAEVGVPYVQEPFHCRIRVGTPLDKGGLRGMAFYGGWFSSEKLLAFESLVADPGDYLEYRGGTELLHFNKDYDLLETITGIGNELPYDGSKLCSYTLHYMVSGDPMRMMLTHIHTVERHVFPL